MFLSFLSSTKTYSHILYVIAAFSFPVHLFGAFCILTKTPAIMHSVKWNMFNLHFWAASLDLSLSFFGQPFVCTPAFAAISLGPMRTIFGIDTNILSYLFMTILMLVAISIVGILEDRYFILFANRTWWRYGRYPFLGINYALGILYYVPTTLQAPEQETARIELFIKLPQLLEFDTHENPIFVLALSNPWITYRQGMMTMLLSVEVLIFVALLYISLKREMSKMTLSERTLKMQSEFLKALRLQIALPLLLFFIPSAILAGMGLVGYQNQGANNLTFLITSVHDDNLRISIDRMKMVSRIINGVYLQQGLLEGTISLGELISEFLKVGPAEIVKMDLEKMEELIIFWKFKLEEGLKIVQNIENVTDPCDQFSKNSTTPNSTNSLEILHDLTAEIIESIRPTFPNFQAMIIVLFSNPDPELVKYSFGFPNGSSDLSQLFEVDLSDPWIRKTLNSESLRKHLKHLEFFEKFMSNVSKKWDFIDERKNQFFAFNRFLLKIGRTRLPNITERCNDSENSTNLFMEDVSIAYNFFNGSLGNGTEVINKFMEISIDLKNVQNILGSKNFTENKKSEIQELSRISKNIAFAVEGIEKMKTVVDRKLEFQSIIPHVKVIQEQGGKVFLNKNDMKNLNSLEHLEPQMELMYKSLENWKSNLKFIGNSSNFSDYSVLFTSAKLVTGVSLDFFNISLSLDKLLERVSEANMKEDLKRAELTIDEMTEIGLNFSKYSKVFENSEKSLKELKMIFTSFESSTFMRKTIANSDDVAMYVLIGVGIFIFFTVFILGLCYLCYADREPKENVGGESKDSEESKMISNAE